MNTFLKSRKFETLTLALGILMALIVGLNYTSGGMDNQLYSSSKIKPVSKQIAEDHESDRGKDNKNCGYLKSTLTIN